MARLRKILFNKMLVYVTTSVEADFMFPQNPLIRLLLESALARAQFHHPVKIVAYLIESTHVHLLIVVENPNDIRGFMNRFKTESAHYVNNLLGRDKRTVWCEGYDAKAVLDSGSFLEKCAYIYTNPAKDGLEDSVERYPGLNSWKEFLGEAPTEKTCLWINRPAFTPLKKFTLAEYSRYAEHLQRSTKKKHTFTVYPDAWMECFGIVEEADKQHWRNEIKIEVRKREEKFREARKKEKKKVLGAEKLMRVRIGAYYLPKREGRRQYYSTKDPALGAQYMARVKAVLQEGEEVTKRWKQGDRSVPFPPGLFPPSFPKLAEMWPPLTRE